MTSIGISIDYLIEKRFAGSVKDYCDETQTDQASLSRYRKGLATPTKKSLVRLKSVIKDLSINAFLAGDTENMFSDPEEEGENNYATQKKEIEYLKLLIIEKEKQIELYEKLFNNKLLEVNTYLGVTHKA